MDTAFFVLSKLLRVFLLAETWIVALLVLGTLAQLFGRGRMGRVLSMAGVLMLLVFAALPVGDWLLRPIERQYPVAPDLTRVDGIIVLGGAEQAGLAQVWGRPQVNDAGERFLEGAALAIAHPKAKLLFAGGSGALRDLGRKNLPQAGMAQQLFISLGIAPDRLILEGTSRNTAENARNALVLARPGPDQVWVLVTSAYHMPRAMQSFHAAGWANIVAWPVDHRTGRFVGGIRWNLPFNLYQFDMAVREIVGSVVYKLTGR